MSQNRNSISKQVLALTAVFALVLSILTYSVADQTSDEYFESWSYELSDTDGDDQYDTILFTFDPNTNVSEYADVEVNMNVRDSDGNYVGGDNEDYEIYWTEEDSFEMEWFVDDCDDWDSECDGPFNFEFFLYENINGYSYFEDNFTESNISLYETTIAPEGIIQIENGVFSDDEDGYHNDIAFLSHMKDYEISNVTIELERKVGTQWVDVGSDETNEEGELFFKNMTSGEYRWFAAYEGVSLDAQSHTFVFYSATSDENIGHVGFMDDFDGDDDFDDFAFYRLIDNGSGSGWNVSDGVYVELFHAENNTLYTEDGGDGDDGILMFNDVPFGNYTFNMYNESSDGDLLQSGWMHSYGSLSTDSDENEYFDWIYDYYYDTDEDGYYDTIEFEYDLDTSCDCYLNVTTYFDFYDNETGQFVDSFDVEDEIYGDEDDYFIDEWSPSYNGSFDIIITLYDEEENLEDEVQYENVQLNVRSESNGTDEDSDEWFHSWNFEVDSFDIEIEYDPNTNCGCEVRVWTYIDVYQDGNKIDTISDDHYIYSDENLWYAQNWTAYEEDYYDFYVVLFDGEEGPDNYEDNFWINDVYLGEEDGNGTQGFNEWFGDVDHRVDRDLLEIGFNPNTEFEGYTNVSIQINIYSDDGTGMLEDTISALIYSDDYDWIEYNWTAYEPGYYYFELRLYDENNNLEEEYYSDDIFLKGNESDNQAWFENLAYTVEDADGDDGNDKVFIDYTIKAECEGEMQLLLLLDIFSQDLDMIDTYELYFTLKNNEILEFTYDWENYHSEEEITFFSTLEYLVDGDSNGEVIVQDSSNTSFYLDVFDYGADFFVEDVTGRDIVFEGQNVEFEVILSGSNDVVVDWNMGDGIIYENAFKVYHTYEDSGNYDIIVHVYDDNNFVEQYFDISVRNVAPTILNIMMDDTVNEGDQVSFNVQYEDVPMDMDSILVTWIFPDGVFQANFVQYTFADDGEFLISVEIKDDDGGATMEQRMVIVQNVAPVFTEFALPSEGEQGVAMDFRVSATDPGDDTITYKFDFGDGTAQLITQDGNVSHKYASGDTFEIIICAIDEDGGETCRTEVIPVALLEQIEDSGLPGFGFLGVISALGAITLLRRRTH